MSFAVDANVLVYASDRASELQPLAEKFLQTSARGPELLYLFWPVLVAYLRIVTHPSIFEVPLTPEQAFSNVNQLVTLPHVRSPGEREHFFTALHESARRGAARGNLISDAHLVALMTQHGIGTIYTKDRDFHRFPGIAVRDPFVGG